MRLTLSFSPCPNDCYMFEAIVNQRIDSEGLEFSIRLADVETLNRSAIAGEADVTKLSYHAFAYCLDIYALLNAGSAMGRNCGPILISRRSISQQKVCEGRISIAIPGKYTTANLLLSLAFPAATNKTEMLFSDIEQALLNNEYDAGLIIHENRFTYEAKGLSKIVDLGESWERATNAPLPLGGIVIKRTLPDELKHKVNRVLRRSVEYALANRTASRDFVLANARELSDEVINRHIDLYVNEYSRDLGMEGRRAVEMLFEKCTAARIIPDSNENLFLNASFAGSIAVA